MAYPNITVAEVRDAIPQITDTIVGDSVVEEKIVDGTAIVESSFAGQIDLTSLKALATTPKLWKLAIIYYTRSLVLGVAYAESRSGAKTEDIKWWQEQSSGLIESILNQKQKLLDSNGDIISVGIGYSSISTNKDLLKSEKEGPYFGYGEFGEHTKDINDRTEYNPNDLNND
jgi:hypothetical protein